MKLNVISEFWFKMGNLVSIPSYAPWIDLLTPYITQAKHPLKQKNLRKQKKNKNWGKLMSWKCWNIEHLVLTLFVLSIKIFLPFHNSRGRTFLWIFGDNFMRYIIHITPLFYFIQIILNCYFFCLLLCHENMEIPLLLCMLRWWYREGEMSINYVKLWKSIKNYYYIFFSLFYCRT